MVVVGINDCVFHGRIAYACDPRANAAYHCARTSELGWGSVAHGMTSSRLSLCRLAKCASLAKCAAGKQTTQASVVNCPVFKARLTGGIRYQTGWPHADDRYLA
jgi:hypothetical protein